MAETIPRIGDEVYVHGYIDEIRKDCIIIRNDGGYFGTVPSEITADRKTEPNRSEKPNNCKDEPQTDICDEYIFVKGSGWCKKCNGKPKGLDALPKKDEPQTDYTPDCPFCKRYGTEDCLGSDCRHYKTYKDEPQSNILLDAMAKAFGVEDKLQTERSKR